MAHLLSSAFRLPKWISLSPLGSRRTAVERPLEGRASAENRGGRSQRGSSLAASAIRKEAFHTTRACSRCNISPRGIGEPCGGKYGAGQREDNREAAIDLFPGCENATRRGSDSESNSAARFQESVMMCSAASDLFESHETL